MIEKKSSFLTVPRWLAVPGLVHGFGDGGWSEAGFAAFAAAKGMTPVVMRQVHGDAVVRLDGPPAAKPEGDALMTGVPGLLLVVRTADCLPVLLVDAERGAVAAVHCGWRGTQKRILEKAVLAMGEAYGSKPADMTAALGPCIGAACYEVGAEVSAGTPPRPRPASSSPSTSSTCAAPTFGSSAGWASTGPGSCTPGRPAATVSRACSPTAVTRPIPAGCIILSGCSGLCKGTRTRGTCPRLCPRSCPRSHLLFENDLAILDGSQKENPWKTPSATSN
ncbi:MAG: polyphenol oxidase family protein [Acidobacteria bacterium]|nr:polyphenol oxidase family protein [Acidobacteriota bacterium]